MQEEALIIFVRQPEWGKVKTRLAADVGNDAALAIYKKLLQHTHSITSVLNCAKFVYSAESVGGNDQWQQGYEKRLQAGSDLGERMKAAFTDLFQKGYQKICIIGSDCFELTAAVLESAFQQLNTHDVVIGPATDGGYYLLGMKGSLKELFAGIDWSTEHVFAQTKAHLERQDFTYAQLPKLSDVDTLADVPGAWLRELGLSK